MFINPDLHNGKSYPKIRQRHRFINQEADAIIKIVKASKGAERSLAITLKGNSAWKLTSYGKFLYFIPHVLDSGTLILEPTNDSVLGYAITHGGQGQAEYIKIQNSSMLNELVLTDVVYEMDRILTGAYTGMFIFNPIGERMSAKEETE